MNKKEKIEENKRSTELFNLLFENICELLTKCQELRPHCFEFNVEEYANELQTSETNRLYKVGHELIRWISKVVNIEASRMIPISSGEVYLIQFGKVYKIGYAGNAKDRFEYLADGILSGFQVIPPYKPKLIHFFYAENAPKSEKKLHEKYRDKRTNGEWFELTEDDVKDICAIEEM